MKLIREINNSLREKDVVELALEAVDAAGAEDCKKYMSPSRVNDFAKAIAELMDQGSSYEDALATAFDETEMPPRGSACCKLIRATANKLRKKQVKEGSTEPAGKSSIAAAKQAIRRTFGHTQFETRSDGFKMTIDAEHEDHAQFDKAIRKSLSDVGVPVLNVLVHDNNRATVKLSKSQVKESERVATYGPFTTKGAAVRNAKSEIGGGTEGYNFEVIEKPDGFYWAETDEEGNLPKKAVKEAADEKKYIVQTRKKALKAWTDETPKLSLADARKVKADFENDKVSARIVTSDGLHREDTVVEATLTEARRKIGAEENAELKRKAVIYRDAEWEEYQVEFYRDGVHQKEATFHTDDKDDAFSTAKVFVSNDNR